jgi:hypothetical protein
MSLKSQPPHQNFPSQIPFPDFPSKNPTPSPSQKQKYSHKYAYFPRTSLHHTNPIEKEKITLLKICDQYKKIESIITFMLPPNPKPSLIHTTLTIPRQKQGKKTFFYNILPSQEKTSSIGIEEQLS